MDVKAWLARRAWLLLATGPFVLFWFITYSRYQALPDSLLGGDMWQQFGIVMHIWSGNAPWTDSMFVGEWAFRDWLMYALVAGISRVTFLPPLTVAIYWPLVPLVIGGAALYGIGKSMFRHEGMGLTMAVLWMGFMPFMGFQSSNLAAMATVPVALYFLVTQDGSLKRRVFLGLAYGAASLSYLVAFFGLSLLLLLSFIERWVRAGARDAWRAHWPVAAVASPIILALWAPILLVYHARVRNASNLFGDNGHGLPLAEALGPLRATFLDTSSVFLVAMGLLAALGVYAAWRQRESHGGKWALLVLIVGLAGSYHYVLTEPLVHTNLVHFRYPKVFLRLASVLLAAQALHFLATSRLRAPASGTVVTLALGVALVGSGFLTVSALSPFDENATASDAKSDATFAAAAWLVKETPKDAVFLSLDHESFALNALTGKKIVIERRSHANPFVDMDQRFADAAVMMYGTDRAFANELMDRYHVTHAYKGFFWDRNLAQFPLFTNRGYEEYWRANGLNFTEDERPYDPIGNVPYFPVITLVPPADPPFLKEFQVVHQEAVDGAPWMTIYARDAPTRPN